jgi:cell shape-determining protein MreC
MTQQSLPRRLLLPVTLVAMFVLTVAPLRVTGWVSWFGGLARVTIAPIEAPLFSIAQFLQRDRSRYVDPDVVKALKEERDQLIAKVEQLEAQFDKQTDILAEFTGGDLLAPRDPPMRQYAPIIGPTGSRSSSILNARGGTNKGVREGFVAVIGGVQIVGRVIEMSILDCQIRPITDRESGGISGVIETPDGDFVDCYLSPTGTGLLEGPVAVSDPSMVMDAIVRLKDDNWPAYVQRYEIGRVMTAVESDEHALTIMVTVQPRIADLSQISEVYILLPTGEDG